MITPQCRSIFNESFTVRESFITQISLYSRYHNVVGSLRLRMQKKQFEKLMQAYPGTIRECSFERTSKYLFLLEEIGARDRVVHGRNYWDVDKNEIWHKVRCLDNVYARWRITFKALEGRIFRIMGTNTICDTICNSQ